MKRRQFFGFLAGAALVLPQVSRPEAAGNTARVAFLQYGERTQDRARYYEGFRQTLSALGWHEGSKLLLLARYADGDRDRLRQFASELVGEQPDVIVAAGGAPTIRALQAVTKTIPIVMVGLGLDPVEAGFVASLSRPGGNITGTISVGTLLNAKRLELLKEIVPQAHRIGVLFNPHTWTVEPLRPAAEALGITLVPIEVRNADELRMRSTETVTRSVDAVAVQTDPAVLESQLATTLALVQRLDVPAVFPWRSYVTAGGLMSYSASLEDLYKRGAVVANRILRGDHPSQLPIEQPERFELAINVKTARESGIIFPASVLLRADDVIE